MKTRLLSALVTWNNRAMTLFTPNLSFETWGSNLSFKAWGWNLSFNAWGWKFYCFTPEHPDTFWGIVCVVGQSSIRLQAATIGIEFCSHFCSQIWPSTIIKNQSMQWPVRFWVRVFWVGKEMVWLGMFCDVYSHSSTHFIIVSQSSEPLHLKRVFHLQCA